MLPDWLLPASALAGSFRMRRHARLRLIRRAPRADFRDGCGLKRRFGCPGWSVACRLLRWSIRNGG